MGDIMTGTKKGWDIDKSITCKKKLIQVFREHRWKRKKQLNNRYVEKGIAVEEEALTLYSLYKGKMFRKNATRLSNSHFTGETDTFTGKEVTDAKHTIDIKSSWDWSTFPSIADSIDGDYEYQGHTYIDLTGATMHTVAFCLVNTPAKLILDEKRRLAWQLGILDTETEEYVNQCIEIEKNCIYDMERFCKENPNFEFHCTEWKYDIPAKERVIEFDFVRDERVLTAMRKRADDGNEWLEKHFKSIILNV
jgi:hypothetical protein